MSPAAQEGSAYRQPPPALDLERALCFHYQRAVAKDNTVRFDGQTLQLLPGLDRMSYAQARVEVQERLDGCLVVQYQGKTIARRPAPPTAPVLRARKRSPSAPAAAAPHPHLTPPTNGAKPRVPAPDHPWRKPLVVTKSQNR